MHHFNYQNFPLRLPRLLHLFLLIVLIVPRSSLTSAQNARKNGRKHLGLTPVEPGTDLYQKRVSAQCSKRWRSYEGTCTNNILRAAGSARTAQYSYFSKISSTKPAGSGLPSARYISNVLSSQPLNLDIFNKRSLSEFLVFFGQFLDHTMVATTAENDETMNIPIPADDSIMANFTSGTLPFTRNERVLVSSELGRRRGRLNLERPVNILPSAIDLASVYGPEDQRASALRLYNGGLLKTSDGDMLPFNTDNFFNAPSSSSDFFLAGDHRANEHPCLLSFHTLFVREHNTLARELRLVFPTWRDNRLFQVARKINIAQFQKIVYEEFFPAITGRSYPRPYLGFQPGTDPSISIEFSAAAFRIGHTMVGHHVTLRGRNMSPMESVPAAAMFFNPSSVKNQGIEPFLRGAMFQRAQEVDTQVVDTLRNFLFTTVKEESGFDLIAMNIQRGRDAACPKYNRLRRRFTGTKKAKSMDQITSDLTLQSKLATAYGSARNVEAWMGLMAEDHMPGSSMGPTLYGIWVEEFGRLRDGDRFFYQKIDLFSRKQVTKFNRINEVYSETDTMAKILYRNTRIVPEEVGRSVWYGQDGNVN